MKKIVFVLGLVIGYVLGARAGRKRYDQIAAGARKVWGSGPVQKQVGRASDFAREKAGEAASSAVKLVADQVGNLVAGRQASKPPAPSGTATAPSTAPGAKA